MTKDQVTIYHGVRTTTSIVVRVGVRVHVSGGSGGLKNTRIIEGTHGLSWFGPIDALRLVAYDSKAPKIEGYKIEIW
jgi:hypothetical protein